MAVDVKTGATPATVLELARRAGTKVVDVRFIDLPGTWQHFSLPLSEFDESASARASASTGPASEASRPSTRATCS
jgi:glutamine synthetase